MLDRKLPASLRHMHHRLVGQLIRRQVGLHIGTWVVAIAIVISIAIVHCRPLAKKGGMVGLGVIQHPAALYCSI